MTIGPSRRGGWCIRPCRGRIRHTQFKQFLSVVRTNNRIGPDLSAAVPRGRSFNGNRVARLDRIPRPTGLLKVDRTFQLDGPVNDIAAVSDIYEEMRMRILPIDFGNEPTQRDFFGVIEFSEYFVMGVQRRRGKSQRQQTQDAAFHSESSGDLCTTY